jgi:hypothetical protein
MRTVACTVLAFLLVGCGPPSRVHGPEAYTLEAALEAWIAGQDVSGLRGSAARAYHKYQKCGIGGATRLFYAGD